MTALCFSLSSLHFTDSLLFAAAIVAVCSFSFSSEWKKRLFVLRQHSLSYYEMADSGVGPGVCKGSIQIAPYSTVRLQGMATAFVARRWLHLCAVLIRGGVVWCGVV
jgi:hypothetical protein